MKQINRVALVNWRLEPNDEAVEIAAVDAVDVGELGVDYVGSMGDEGFDLVGVEWDFEEVMGVSWFTSWSKIFIAMVVKMKRKFWDLVFGVWEWKYKVVGEYIEEKVQREMIASDLLEFDRNVWDLYKFC